MAQQKEIPAYYRTELHRVLESDAFRHSDSLRRLLEYLGEKALSGSDSLKEYTIGVEAFHKPPDYNPQEDPTIRVLASKLRHKLNEYYGKEGVESPIRLEVPRGHYELRFQPRAEDEASLQKDRLRGQILMWRRTSLALGACAVVFLSLAIHRPMDSTAARQAGARPEAGWTPELEMIWQPFLESDHPLVISLGTPLFTKLARTYFRNPRINEWTEAQASDQIKLLQKDLQSDYAVPAYPYTGVGEATGAFLLSKLLLARKPEMLLKRSIVLSWDDVRASDVIFLGPPKFNQLLKDIPADEGFAIERGAIRNSRPRPGEPEAYRSTWSQDQTQLMEDYALIHRLPGPHHHGEIMILASASTEGTWAAVEYVTKVNYAAELVNRVKTADGKLPRSFQAVIRVECKQQVPWKISFVTHRILDNPWKSSPLAR
jgi:hypothetical protein